MTQGTPAEVTDSQEVRTPAPNPLERLTLQLWDPQTVFADTENPILVEYQRLKNNLMIELFRRIQRLDVAEEEGFSVAEVADLARNEITERLFHTVTSALEKFESFAHEFSDCISAGPGCDHEPEDHDALLRVWKLGRLR